MPPQMGGRMGSHMTGGQMTSRMGAMPGHPYPGNIRATHFVTCISCTI